MKQPKFEWNPEEGIATCTIYDSDGQGHVGVAKCHADDADMMSEKTGFHIAHQRAIIEAYKAYKKKCSIELKALKQLYYSMKHSKKFNSKSYESIMLYRQMRIKEEDIAAAQSLISLTKMNLKMFISQKDAFYKTVRQRREKTDS